MLETAPPQSEATPLDAGLRALCGIAAYYRIAADPVQLARERALGERRADESDLIRAAKMMGLKARLVTKVPAERLATLPTPAIVRTTDGALLVFAAARPQWLGAPEDVPRSGRDLMLAIDTSGSMSIEDMQLGGMPAPGLSLR